MIVAEIRTYSNTDSKNWRVFIVHQKRKRQEKYLSWAFYAKNASPALTL
jgi:hypothetical protein